MSTSQVSCDKPITNDLDLFVDKIKEISHEDSLKIQRKEKPSAPDAEVNVSYCEPTDMPSTSQIPPYIHGTYKILNKTVGHNSAYLETNPYCFANYTDGYPSAPELDADECDKQFDAMQYATPVVKFNLANYAEPLSDLDAIEYADDSTCRTNNSYKSAFDNTATVEDPSAPELDADEYAMTDNQFDATPLVKINSALYAVHKECDLDEMEYAGDLSDISYMSAFDSIAHVEDKGFEYDGYPSAPELDADEYAITSDQFDGTPPVKINSARYAVPKECDLDAIEYADDLSFYSTAHVEKKGFETIYVKPERQESHMYRMPCESIVKKKKGGLSKLKSNIFGLVRKKYKKCFPSKNYGWDRSDSWIKITVV